MFSETAVHQASTATTSKEVPKSTTWEVDFCSRPLLDERGKKVWELLICDPERNFEYSEYFPNSKINSAEVCAPPRLSGFPSRCVNGAGLTAGLTRARPPACSQLKRAVERILAQPGAQRPEKARFFRSQMQTIINKALTDCQIKAVPSRRCFTVMCESPGQRFPPRPNVVGDSRVGSRHRLFYGVGRCRSGAPRGLHPCRLLPMMFGFRSGRADNVGPARPVSPPHPLCGQGAFTRSRGWS